MLELLNARLPNLGMFPPEVGRLHIDGTTFRREDGGLFQWRGYSWFLGFLRYCRGDDITPDLRWMRAFGFNLPRVFGPLPWTETPDYRIEHFDFVKFDAFLSLLESYGLRCNFSVGHYPGVNWKKFDAVIDDLARGHWNLVKERVNEPRIGAKPDPIRDFPTHTGKVLTSYGWYESFYENIIPPVLDFGTVHIPRDAAWHRKARHVQELQAATKRPWISDEPAKVTEPGFSYPGGKNDPATTPNELVWHAAVCLLYTPGVTYHCEEGKWGRVPTHGMLQHTCAERLRDDVFLKIDAHWQTGAYNGSHHTTTSPVDFVRDVWAYSSLHATEALAVRCAPIPLKAINGWRIVESWANGTIARLTR